VIRDYTMRDRSNSAAVLSERRLIVIPGSDSPFGAVVGL
jgi:hypothetical protein